MKQISDFNDPCSFRYEMRTSFGLVAQDLSVDIKIFITDPSYYSAICLQLWRSTIATAISRDVRLDMAWLVRWNQSPLAFPVAPMLLDRGRQSGTPAGKAHTATVIMHTGHSDNLAARRLYLPSTPLRWQTDTMLNGAGWDSLLTWAQGVRMGLAADDLGGDLQHLIAYPRIIEPTLENLAGVGFRTVSHLKVLQYTDKCPDFDGGLWP
jgi:hypothetical protein